MRKYTLLLLFFSLTWAACLTTSYTMEELPPTRVHFGEGGGFAGTKTEYILLENGQLFQKPAGEKQFQELSTLPRAKSKLLFAQVDSLRLHRYDFYHPGNLYFFLRQTTEVIDHTVQWGEADRPVREDVQRVYYDLLAAAMGQKVVKEAVENPEEEDSDKPYGW